MTARQIGNHIWRSTIVKMNVIIFVMGVEDISHYSVILGVNFEQVLLMFQYLHVNNWFNISQSPVDCDSFPRALKSPPTPSLFSLSPKSPLYFCMCMHYLHFHLPSCSLQFLSIHHVLLLLYHQLFSVCILLCLDMWSEHLSQTTL